MDRFYFYFVRFMDDYSGEEKTDRGVVYSPQGNIANATAKVCADYSGKNFSNVMEVRVENIYEDGEFTICEETLKEIFNSRLAITEVTSSNC